MKSGHINECRSFQQKLGYVLWFVKVDTIENPVSTPEARIGIIAAINHLEHSIY